jgi:phosphate transport system protein
LELLEMDLLKMATQTEIALRDAMEAFFKRDDRLADKVIDGDDVIDKYDLEIENKCMCLLALQQPMARDLRVIGSISKIITDLERIADHAVDIAKITKALNILPPFKTHSYMEKLLETVADMLHQSIKAFINRDIDMVKRMCAMDDEVDARYKSMYNEVIGMMEKDPAIIKQGVHMLSILRYLERVADHATNIGERTAYINTGELEEFNV